MMKYTIFLVLFVINISFLSAQGIINERIKLAETLEKNGDYKSAIKIYQELYNTSPSNETVFQGLVRSMTGSNSFSELLPIVENHIAKYSKTTLNYCILAELQWKTGSPNNANDSWDKSLTIEPINELTFITAANSQSKLLLFEKAVSTLEKARDILNKKDIFSEELCRLYTAEGNYLKASDEILVLYEKTRNLPQAQGRISALLVSEEAKQYLEKSIKSKTNDENILFLNLYAWLLKALNKLDESLEKYILLDSKTAKNGYEVYSFANACSKDEQFEAALKAYAYVMELGKKSPYLVNSMFGFTRCLEEKNAKQKSVNFKDYQDIIERYQNLVNLYPGNSISFEAMYRIGCIYKDILHKDTQAAEVFNNMYKTGKQFPITYKGLHKLADIYFEADSIENYKNTLRMIYNANAGNINNEKDLSLFKLAEIEYFTGNIDSALVLFNEIAQNVTSNVSNDALEKSFMLEQNKNLNKAIKVFAKAEMMQKQGNIDSALSLFKQVVEITAAGENLFELSIMRISDIYKNKEFFNDQRAFLNKLITEDPLSIYLDFAYFNIANSYFIEKKFDEALKYYTDMLVKFPKFIYIEEIREKIKQIRNRPNG